MGKILSGILFLFVFMTFQQGSADGAASEPSSITSRFFQFSQNGRDGSPINFYYGMDLSNRGKDTQNFSNLMSRFRRPMFCSHDSSGSCVSPAPSEQLERKLISNTPTYPEPRANLVPLPTSTCAIGSDLHVDSAAVGSCAREGIPSPASGSAATPPSTRSVSPPLPPLAENRCAELPDAGAWHAHILQVRAINQSQPTSAASLTQAMSGIPAFQWYFSTRDQLIRESEVQTNAEARRRLQDFERSMQPRIIDSMVVSNMTTISAVLGGILGPESLNRTVLEIRNSDGFQQLVEACQNYLRSNSPPGRTGTPPPSSTP